MNVFLIYYENFWIAIGFGTFHIATNRFMDKMRGIQCQHTYIIFGQLDGLKLCLVNTLCVVLVTEMLKLIENGGELLVMEN